MSSFPLDMRARLRLPRSLSLTVQLSLTLVGLVVVTTTVLMVVAYNSSRGRLESEARETAHLVAQQHEQTIARVIELRHQRAQAFLDNVVALCGETNSKGRLAFELECLGRGLEVFSASERARGARFVRDGRRLAQVGEAPADDLVYPAPFARLVRRGDEFDYGIRAVRGRSSLTLQFPADDLASLFMDRSGLGQRGEVFLVSATGVFLTAPRYGPEGLPLNAGLVEPIRECVDGATDTVGLDYRGVSTIHGLRRVGLLIEPLCVDAHLSYDEALAPADRLWNDLLARGAIFALFGALLSLLASQWIALPVRRLARAVRALQDGEIGRASCRERV